MKKKNLVIALAMAPLFFIDANANQASSSLSTTARYYPAATNSYYKYSSIYRNNYTSWYNSYYSKPITRTVTTTVNGVTTTKIYTTVNGRTTVRVITSTVRTPIVTNPRKPVVETPTKPVVDTKPVVETPTKPIVDTKPVVETPTKPVVDTKPVVETPTKPVVDTKPVVETPTKPVVDTKPVVETPTKPVVETPIIIKPSTPIINRPIVVAENVPVRGVQWNDVTRGYNLRDPNNKQNVNLDGKGVIVGILDSGFKNNSMADDITKKFGDRGIVLETGRTAPSSATHGVMVAEMVGGNTTNGVAPGATLLLSDITKITLSGTGLLATKSIYNDLWNRGARIYNQSYGIPKPLTYFNDRKNSIYYYAHQMDSSLLDWYKEKVDQGGLFVWAAGNTRGDKNPTLQAGLPYYEPELEKGWIAVAALATKTNADLGNVEWNNLLPYSQAGVAKNWTISAVGDYAFNLNKRDVVASGSSFASPAVTGTAALVKQKYPWMDGNLIKQSILTTATDIGEQGVDDVYGWGLLNVEKAVKGPARFDTRLTKADNVSVNIPSGSYIFENDIDGDAGLIKNGAGELVLAGDSSFTGDTTLHAGAITINGKSYASKINVGENGTLVTNNTTLENKVSNQGTLINQGSSTIQSDYEAAKSSRLVSTLGSTLNVKGNVDLNDSTLTLTSNKGDRAEYVTAKGVTNRTLIADGIITGNFSKIESVGLLNVKAVQSNPNEISTTVSRANVVDYVNETSSNEKMWENVATALENSFTVLDNKLENDSNGLNDSFVESAAVLQNSITDVNARSAVLDSLSGQIYASAQALTFENSETVNKDLSNRLVMLGALDHLGDNAGVWVTGIYGNGVLKENGFGEGKTNTYAGQLGIDKKIFDDFILGAAFNYSKAKVEFDRYGGSSKADGIGASLYARLGNKHKTPWYLQGRLGFGRVDSDVERNIILDDSNVSTAKINHKDRVLSAYIESGYDFRMNNVSLTPFVGLNHDVVRRGAFSEQNSQFGLTADKATYKQTSGLIGLRTSLDVDWKGMKTTIQGYVNHQRAFKEQDLSFKANYTGLSDAKFDVKGISLARNKTWVGVGVLTQVNKNVALYSNYDLKLSGNKGRNNVVTAGIRINF
ncbi:MULTISPECIES: autotransporter domain-containing protein [Glaesserella]|uniref:Autotransporter outer membrane beta-barrel domain-containing protein n=1 Tax=Glaesserella australis TaxID=2094024 RepID=A0A328BX64_9PAST|nr:MULTISPECIES: autotransporter domain-containing protein [Glaesserella]AUI66632.1 autotransporter outer membrane beta-barrel domain-containing protein [Glaesserella sp. 15-184]RAL18806.1 autotransporter outer membrane beta-barrel domain-containing protein [Glaesserella australis]